MVVAGRFTVDPYPAPCKHLSEWLPPTGGRVSQDVADSGTGDRRPPGPGRLARRSEKPECDRRLRARARQHSGKAS
jgi:hypothetical protein